MSRAAAYLQATPLAVILAVFLLVPIATIVVVSFWDYDESTLIPSFVLDNYRDALGSAVTWRTYVATLRYAVVVWALTLSIGFTVAYFLAFHVRSALWQMVLFQLCAIPFLTSNIIRMISWIPVPRPQRAAEPGAAGHGTDPPSAGVPAVLGLRRGADLRAPVTRCSWWCRSSTPCCASTAA